jgi:xanthine dehydrogenase YagR molybdenum-binding subunit
MAEAETPTTKPAPAPAAAPTGEQPTPRASRDSAPQEQPKDNVPGRLETILVGIPQSPNGLKPAERRVAETDPPPMAPNKELKHVGKPTPRWDGRAKVTGAARYTADVKLPGMLYGRMITSPHPHAKIKSIDTSAAEKAPGVKAVHVLERLRDVAQLQDPSKEIPSKYPIVRFAGQPIGGVAADTAAQAEAAARLVKVEYELLPFVTDVHRAREPNAPVVFPGPANQGGTGGGGGGARGVPQVGNVRGPAKGGTRDLAEGALEKALADSEVVVEGEFHTQVQTHSPLETHGVVVDFKDDGITCYASTQGTASVRNELAEVFEMPGKVRVITEYMGGGFGSKFGMGNYGMLAAHLSKKAKAPVKLMLDRKDEHLSVGNRPDSHQKLKVGAKKDGTLTAIHLVNYGTGGVGTGAGASRPAQALYPCPVIATEDYDVFTHAGPAAAFRAPGHPQGVFAFEQMIDELAEKLGMDVLDLYEKIDVNTDRSDAHRIERKIAAERFGWKEKRRPPASDKGPIKRGVGVAQSLWGRFNSRDASCEVRITRDGSVELLSGVQDIGTGIKTALAQVVAEELGLKPTDIMIRIGDTRYPVGPGSGGSVTTNSITPPARNAAWQVKRMLLEQVAPSLGANGPDDLVMADGKVALKSDPSKSLSFRAAAGKLKTEDVTATAKRSDEYTQNKLRPDGKGGAGVPGSLGGVQFVEVAVDTETGVVKVERVLAVHDCGRPINPLGLESQINGGIIQGISYALYENRLLDRNTGMMVNPNLEQYKITGSMETPVIECLLIEDYAGRSSTDAAGIGEPATVPTAAAVANAVYNAIGVRVRSIPMTPAVVLAALSGGGGKGKGTGSEGENGRSVRS